MSSEQSLTGQALRNVVLLASCQALMMSVMSMSIATTPVVASGMLIDKAWATLPLFLIQTGIMVATIPASLIMARIGRRNGFLIGALIGIASGLIYTWSIFRQDFELLCIGSFLQGSAIAVAWYYRFAAADAAPPLARAKAISFVLIGGVVSGTLGPEVAKLAKDMFAPVTYAGIYVVFSIFAAMVVGILFALRLPPVAVEKSDGGRQLSEIARQPAFVVAVLSSLLGYGMMTVLMAATPLAMLGCGFGFSDGATVIQFHSLAMFLPSFFTGSLINRFGVLRIIATGGLLQAACFMVALSGVAYENFMVANILLGLGWNFCFIGGSTLLTTTYRPAERAKTQAAHDFLVYATTAVAAGIAGIIQAKAGWEVVNMSSMPFTLIIVAAAAWLALRLRQAPVEQT